ncbi:hypothetical protein RUM43_004400 [Polyplax serrata]|uniref:Uncharacterized protein n=1 Tax=Polyplax serrata TaxID=468196 RepID=A0AAN8SAU5_POLSC
MDLLKNLSEVCVDETELPESILDGLKKAKISDDPRAKCYIKCMMRQLQSLNEDGVLDVELIEATMPDELKKHGGVETVKKCSHIKEDDMCETAYKLILCFQKENPELTALFE